MRVYIKNMRMPKSCDCCSFANYEYQDCLAWGCEGVRPPSIYGKPNWCPLVEIPKHGRLIDAYAFSFLLNDEQVEYDPYYKGLGRAKVLLEYAPTVIEKEEV